MKHFLALILLILSFGVYAQNDKIGVSVEEIAESPVYESRCPNINDPIYLINYFEICSEELNEFEPEEIESVEVVKSIEALEEYKYKRFGEKRLNGVVDIKLKDDKSPRLMLLDGEVATEEFLKELDIRNYDGVIRVLKSEEMVNKYGAKAVNGVMFISSNK